MKLLVRICVVIFLLGFSISCGEEADNIIVSQEQTINRFINTLISQNKNLTVASKGGINYILLEGDSIVPVQMGDSVWFNYSARTLNDTNIFATNIKEDAIRFGLDTSLVFEPIKIIAGKNTLISGVDLGLQMGYLNDEALVIFNSTYGYGDNNTGIVPPNSPLLFWIKIVNVKGN